MPPAPPAQPAYLCIPARSAQEFERAWRSAGGSGPASAQTPQRSGLAAFFLLYTMAGDGAGDAGLLCEALRCGAPAAPLYAARAWPAALFRSGMDAEMLVEVTRALAAVLGPAPALSGGGGGGGDDEDEQPQPATAAAVALIKLPFPALAGLAAASGKAFAGELGFRACLALRGVASTPRLTLAAAMLSPDDRALLDAVARTAAAVAMGAVRGCAGELAAAALASGLPHGEGRTDEEGCGETAATGERLAKRLTQAILGARSKEA